MPFQRAKDINVVFRALPCVFNDILEQGAVTHFAPVACIDARFLLDGHMFYRGIPQIFIQNILWNFEGLHLVLLDAELHLHTVESLLGGERFSHVGIFIGEGIRPRQL